MNMGKKAILVIMDGWGLGTKPEVDAIQNADTQFVDSLYVNYPHAQLSTCGNDVGLPQGQMGNSEVGHLNLGAGRIVYQELEKINVSIRNGEFANNATLLQAIEYALHNNKPIHLMGLLSDGGVHSHINHLQALIQLLHQHTVPQVYIHAFTDGRDTDPKGGINYLHQCELFIKDTPYCIATVMGRYYAMDRDKRWERVAIAYNALTNGSGEATSDIIQTVSTRYEQGQTDEFLMPIIAQHNGKNIATINEGDVVICFNFRTDRCREITEVLTQQAFAQYNMQPLPLHYVTFTEYDKKFKNIQVLFKQQDLTQTLGEVIANAGLTQARLAETEKYPHVTFFFSGGREQPFEGESRIMVDSPKDVATYDLKPEMSAYPLTEAVLQLMGESTPDFICLNYANADMVGHTGVWEAAIAAANTVDKCVQQVVTKALELDYTIFVTADHGNSDYLINDDGTPNTAHTLNPVPIFIVSNWYKGPVQNGILADVAPSILASMGLAIPAIMSGKVLISVK
jgi:2,3-bisphosphoglycerate-independent phosphoglycerate mutase